MKILVQIFWNHTEGRFRLVWRLAAQFLLMSVFLLIFQLISSYLNAGLSSLSGKTGSSAAQELTSPIQELLTISFAGLAVVASVYLSARVIDRRKFADLGLALSSEWWADFAFGLNLGALLMLALFITELSLGWIDIQDGIAAGKNIPELLPGILISLLSFIAIGFYEELFSRGYQIKNLAEGLSGKSISPRLALLAATALSSIYFGLIHAANPHAAWPGIINISLAGLLLAAGYLITGQLAISIGLHISWNFFQGPIFGFPVSGWSAQAASLFQIQQLGPSIWTGGAFGPEGGLIGTLAILLGLVLVILFKGKRAGLFLGLTRFTPARQSSGQNFVQPTSILGSQPKQIQHIIWDWNGTLLNDLDLCLKIINSMLNDRDLPLISKAFYLEAFDFPVKDYYQKIGFDFSRESFESISTQFIHAYESGRPECELMEGARNILALADERGLSQSILSASKKTYLKKAVSEYGIQGYFNSVSGLDNHHAAGKLNLAREFLENCQFDPGQLLLVGDTTHDGAIAAQLGARCVLIPNGHHSRKRLEETNWPVLNSLADLDVSAL